MDRDKTAETIVNTFFGFRNIESVNSEMYFFRDTEKPWMYESNSMTLNVPNFMNKVKITNSKTLVKFRA